MKLNIFSSTESHEYDINYLEVETSVGNFVILEGHEPLLLLLSADKPIIFCQKDAPETFERFPLNYGGILKVTRTHATLIVNE
jgi:F0F1-type ATP synthase epsilon subunit